MRASISLKSNEEKTKIKYSFLLFVFWWGESTSCENGSVMFLSTSIL